MMSLRAIEEGSITGVSPRAADDSTGSIAAGAARELPRLETQDPIQRGRDIDHVYALQEVVPGWGGTKRHSAGRIFPDGNHDAGHLRRDRAPLKRFLNASLLCRRSFPEGAVHGHNDYVLTIVSQMRHLKGGHCIGPVGVGPVGG